MDLDNLKQAWNTATVTPPDPVATRNIRHMRDARSRVIRTYRVLVVLSFAMAVLIWPLDNKLQLGLMPTLVYSVFMVCMGVVNLYYLCRVRALDITKLTVAEALIAASRLYILRNRLQMLSIPLGIVVLSIFLYELWCNPSAGSADPDHVVFWGGIAGGVIGIIAGLRMDWKLRKLIRQMSEDLRRELDGETL